MKAKIRILVKQNIVFLSLFAIALIVHLFLPLNWADDEVFLKKTADTDILTFLNGSARPFTDGLTYIFTRNQWLWRILNPCVLTTLFWTIQKTIPAQPSKKQLIFAYIAATFPTMVMVDAGFVATTVNYLWPVTFGILNLLPLINYYYDKKTSKPLLFLLIPFLMYSTNMQQMCVVLLAIFLFANIYFILKKSVKPYILLQFVITLTGTISSLILNFTGDNSRILRETGRYFPDFGHLNLFEKVELGFSSTFYCMTMEIHFAFAGFLTFALFLSTMCFKKKKSIVLKICSIIPPLSAIVFTVTSLISGKNSVGNFRNYGLEKAVYSFEPALDIMFIFIGLIMVYCIWNLIDSKGHQLFGVSVFLLGLGSRMLMGFSPTVWASGYRTFCILFITFIYIALTISSPTNKAAE